MGNETGKNFVPHKASAIELRATLDEIFLRNLDPYAGFKEVALEKMNRSDASKFGAEIINRFKNCNAFIVRFDLGIISHSIAFYHLDGNYHMYDPDSGLFMGIDIEDLLCNPTEGMKPFIPHLNNESLRVTLYEREAN